ncbi:hypothetical protein ESZ50_04915 [Weissella muntiaci]|uniref:DUF968 domain-containing protein n=1 Tax=Weissella muntiaci TaxID=2508881 RepID=A0A6C2C7P4_9LACO|nr:putative HNHc nuclease [Weissella muntiaci]TYC49934.1 hypothetical protein ESZ50_04915 [Weissella muntiaci]
MSEFDIFGHAVKIVGNKVTIVVENSKDLKNLSLQLTQEQPQVVLHIPDERHVSMMQIKKAHALMNDIAKSVGDDARDMKHRLKYLFMEEEGSGYFSFASTDVTTARKFINFLLDFALENNIPLEHRGIDYVDQNYLEAYMYMALKHRACVLCGRPADVHHVDTVGMGNDRRLVDHRNKRLIALCRIHHGEAHDMGWDTFSEVNHVVGIILPPETLKSLGIMTQQRMDELDGKRPVTLSDEGSQ